MSDLISRQAVLDELENYSCLDKKDIETIIKSLPSVENKGEWEIYIISMLDGEGCKCSECGFEGVPYWNYCPNCGASMKGGE